MAIDGVGMNGWVSFKAQHSDMPAQVKRKATIPNQGI